MTQKRVKVKTINNQELIGTGNISVSTFSGSYNDLSNKPSIPSKTSDLNNDSGFITSSSLPTKTSDLQNDGSSSSDSLVYVETSATNGLLKSDGSVDTNSYIKDTELIPINSDLDEYTEVGVYYCNLQPTGLATLLNAPTDVTSGGNGFCLFVENTNVYDNGVKQTLTTFAKSNTFVRNFWTDHDEVYHTTGWKPVYEDTGWKDMTFPTGFTHYTTTEQRAKYRRIGKVVYVRGAVKNTNAFTPNTNNGTTICTIGDTSCRPQYFWNFVQQGSGMNRFLLRVESDGKINILRYGTTSASQVEASSWLNIHCSFVVE